MHAEEVAIAKERKQNFKGLFGPSPENTAASTQGASTSAPQASQPQPAASLENASAFTMIAVLVRRFFEYIFGLFGLTSYLEKIFNAAVPTDSLEEDVKKALQGSQDAKDAADRIESLYNEYKQKEASL